MGLGFRVWGLGAKFWGLSLGFRIHLKEASKRKQTGPLKLESWQFGFVVVYTHRLLSSSFLWLIFRIL